SRATYVEIDPGLIAEGRRALQHSRHDPAVLLDFPLGMLVDAKIEEVKQIVEIDLPVPLRVRRKRKIDTRKLTRDLISGEPFVRGLPLPADRSPPLQRFLERRV